MRVDLRDIAEQLIVLLARAALGIFLSGILGLGLYIVLVIPIVHSFWQPKDVNFALVAVLTIGLGAGVGSFLAWLDRDLSRSATILMLFRQSQPLSSARGSAFTKAETHTSWSAGPEAPRLPESS